VVTLAAVSSSAQVPFIEPLLATVTFIGLWPDTSIVDVVLPDE
jgi:hypothetical protein